MPSDYSGDGPNDESSKPDKPYKVGYKKPPTATQWTSEHQPGKRRSRKGIRNLKTEVAEFMNEQVWVTGPDGKRRRMSRRMSLIRQTYARGHNKESNTALRLLELDARFAETPESSQSVSDVSEQDAAIMAQFYDRARREVSAEEAVAGDQVNETSDPSDDETENDNGDA